MPPESTDKQTVAEDPKDQSETGAAGAGAQDSGPSLDDLLKEFEAGAKPEPKAETPETGKESQNDEVLAYVKRQQAKEFEAEFADVVKKVKGDHKVPDIFVEGFIERTANKNPQLVKLWEQRDANPGAFESAVKALGADFAKHLAELPDRDATDDREAVAAAVRGASTRPPDPDDVPDNVAGMNDAQFESWVNSLRK